MRAPILGKRLFATGATFVLGSAAFVASGRSAAARMDNVACCGAFNNGTDPCRYIDTESPCGYPGGPDNCSNGQTCCTDYQVCTPPPL